jgi:ankyrin repeat protein
MEYNAGQAEVVRYLLDLGAEADDHALSLAVDKGHDEVARLLISRGVNPKDNPEVLSRAVLQNNITLGTPHHRT